MRGVSTNRPRERNTHPSKGRTRSSAPQTQDEIGRVMIDRDELQRILARASCRRRKYGVQI
jgi:hypothetical protein